MARRRFILAWLAFAGLLYAADFINPLKIHDGGRFDDATNRLMRPLAWTNVLWHVEWQTAPGKRQAMGKLMRPEWQSRRIRGQGRIDFATWDARLQILQGFYYLSPEGILVTNGFFFSKTNRSIIGNEILITNFAKVAIPSSGLISLRGHLIASNLFDMGSGP